MLDYEESGRNGRTEAADGSAGRDERRTIHGRFLTEVAGEGSQPGIAASLATLPDGSVDSPVLRFGGGGFICERGFGQNKARGNSRKATGLRLTMERKLYSLRNR